MTKDNGTSGRKSPLLTGLVIGVFIGIAASVAVAIWLNVRGSPFQERVAPAELPPLSPAPPKPAQPAAGEDAAGDAGKRFDFYDILPGGKEAGDKPAAPPSAQLYLQVGAYRNAAEADDQKARLALLGQTATIQRVESNGGFIHRIRVGPFASAQELDAARAFLRDNGIDSVPVRPDPDPR